VVERTAFGPTASLGWLTLVIVPDPTGPVQLAAGMLALARLARRRRRRGRA